MQRCPSPECPHLRRVGRAAEYEDGVARCSDCGARLAPGAPAGPRPLPPIAPALWTRLAVTAACAAALFGLRAIALPGVEIARSSGELLGLFRPGDRSMISVGALGILPWLSGAGLVELVALAVPRLRPLRLGPPARRAMIDRAALVVGLAIALLQGFGVARYIESLTWGQGYSFVPSPIGVRPFPGLVPVITLTTAAGGAVILMLARAIARRGLGGGVALLLVASLPGALVSSLLRPIATHEMDPFVLVIALALLGGAALVLVLGLRGERSPRGFQVRLPASGLAPIAIAAQLLALPRLLANWGVSTGGLAHLVPAGSTVYFAALIALSSLLAIPLGWLFHRPEAMAELLARAPALADAPATLGERRANAEAAVRARLPIALRSTVIVLALVVGVQAMLASEGFEVDLLLFALGTATARDLAAEWRARRRLGSLEAIWPLHRAWAAEPALRALEAAGLPAHARGQSVRALTHLFGPLFPVEILVAPANAEAAAAVLSRLFADDPSAPPEARGGIGVPNGSS